MVALNVTLTATNVFYIVRLLRGFVGLRAPRPSLIQIH
jgi:hypothetical protein